MKALIVLVGASLLLHAAAEEFKPIRKYETNSVPERLVQKHDANTNGVIDIHERKEYLRERARERRAARLKAAEARARAPRVQGAPAAWDTNRNGKIERLEILAAEAGSRENARTNRLNKPSRQP
jgi:hypothetical protein